VKFSMTATTAAGNQNWTLEAASPTDLGRKGWTRNTLKTGDQITVERYRAKSEPMTAAARVIELPDGKRLSAADDKDAQNRRPFHPLNKRVLDSAGSGVPDLCWGHANDSSAAPLPQ
jgi:hypothetical protein